MRCFVSVLLAATALAGPSIHDPVAARAERRSRLAKHLGKDYALVLGQPLTDVLQPRQEGHFLYLTGVDDPDAVAVWGPECQSKPVVDGYFNVTLGQSQPIAAEMFRDLIRRSER